MMEYLGTMAGPDFLVLFAVWFVFTYGGVLVCRSAGWDTPMVTIVGLALFEGLGALRFIAGTQHGLQRWGILIGMMILGGFIFTLRKSNLNRTGRGGGSSGCGSAFGCGSAGSSSSCGSGGSSCGGGGCGGCGGS